MARPRSAHPLQRVQWDGRGVVRFRANAIVRHLLDFASTRGCSLNELVRLPFSRDDREQFAQLIGYSVSGAGDLSYMRPSTIAEADALAEALVSKRRRKP